jgi:hypothetical protein
MTLCLAPLPHVVAGESSVYKSRLLWAVNWIFAACYVYAIARVLMRWMHGNTSLVGSLALVLVLLFLAFGHLRLRLWASQVTAAMLVVATIFAIFILPGGFEPEVLPSTEVRIFLVLSIATIASAAVANYIVCKREEQRVRSGAGH